MELRGKVALVTGAARGIGRAIALKLAAEGVHIAAADLSSGDPSIPYELSGERELNETIALVEKHGVQGVAIAADVTRNADVERTIRETEEKLGRLDILVNNAGVVAAIPVAMMPEELWDRLMAVNVKGVFLCCKAAIPALTRQGEGRIINISSIAGKTGRAGVAAYCASKFAVIGFTQALAEELGPLNITVNAICPGFLRTHMWDKVLDAAVAMRLNVEEAKAYESFVAANTYLKRDQPPEDIGDTTVFLCRSDNITGIALNVAGGAEVH